MIDSFAAYNPALSPEASRAAEDARRNAHWYAMPCAHCGHPRRAHGKYRCFTEACACKHGFHEKETKR